MCRVSAPRLGASATVGTGTELKLPLRQRSIARPVSGGYRYGLSGSP